MSALKYRSDIDGLRAVAVIAVILFHMGMKSIPGGFAGVDVFFVISGYLISTIIFNDIDQGKFSILRFYERRIKRIQPALFFVIFLTAVACTYILIPIDYKFFAQSVGATATFSSNIYFYIKSGYFDPLSETKPLLHTWSLAVEEQFYLFFPLILIFLYRYANRYINKTLVILALLSFGLSLFQSRLYPDAAFYLPFDRFWELLIGSIIARKMLPVISSRYIQSCLGYLGLAAICAGYLLLNDDSTFPGDGALLPCLGTALVIYSEGLFAGRAYSNLSLTSPLFIFVGKISYSLYLWHWPLLVLAKYYLLRNLNLEESILYLAITFIFAWGTWRFIEKPFRDGKFFQVSRKKVFFVTSIVTFAAIAFAFFVQIGNGLPRRFGDPARRYAEGALDINPKRKQCDRHSAEQIRSGDVCKIGNESSGPPTFALIGDSFGDAISPGIDYSARELGISGLLITNSGCFPIIGITQIGHPECSKFNDAVLHLIKSTPSITKVILVGRWTSALLGTRFGQFPGKGWYIVDGETVDAPSYAENRLVFERSLKRTIEKFGPHQVTIIAHIPEQRFDIPRALALNVEFNKKEVVDLAAPLHVSRQHELRQILESTRNIADFSLIDVGAELCNATVCQSQNNGLSLYVDDNHLSTNAAIFLSPLWKRVLSN